MAGTYQPTSSTQLLYCLPCPVGTYQPSEGASTCVACAGWTSTVTTGAKASSACINLDLAGLNRGDMYNLGTNQMAYYPFLPTSPLKDVSGQLGSLTASTTAPTIITNGPWSSSSAAKFTQSGSTCLLTSRTTGQYYKLPSSLSFPSTSLTVCLWFSPSYKFSIGRTRLFEFSAAVNSVVGEIAFYEAGADGASTSLAAYLQGQSSTSFTGTVGTGKWATTKWTHLCAAIQGSTMTAYFDATPVTFTLSAPVPQLTRTVNYIARSNWGGDCFFTGSMAQLRIFNRALSAAEVKALYSWMGDSASPNVAVPCAAQCTAGSAQVCNPSTGAVSCVLCAAGRFQTGAGGSACTLCGAGTFQTGSGMTKCTSCEASSFQTGLGMISSGDCQQCAGGTTSTGVGQVQNSCTSNPGCPCGLGTFCNAGVSCKVNPFFTCHKCSSSRADNYCLVLQPGVCCRDIPVQHIHYPCILQSLRPRHLLDSLGCNDSGHVLEMRCGHLLLWLRRSHCSHVFALQLGYLLDSPWCSSGGHVLEMRCRHLPLRLRRSNSSCMHFVWRWNIPDWRGRIYLLLVSRGNVLNWIGKCVSKRLHAQH